MARLCRLVALRIWCDGTPEFSVPEMWRKAPR